VYGFGRDRNPIIFKFFNFEIIDDDKKKAKTALKRESRSLLKFQIQKILTDKKNKEYTNSGICDTKKGQEERNNLSMRVYCSNNLKNFNTCHTMFTATGDTLRTF